MIGAAAGRLCLLGRYARNIVASWPTGRLFLCNDQTYCLEIGGATLVGDDPQPGGRVLVRRGKLSAWRCYLEGVSMAEQVQRSAAEQDSEAGAD